MSQEVPLSNTNASQTLSINLGGQACLIALQTLGLDPDAHLYFTLSVAGVPVVTTRVCRNLQLLLADAGYRGFQGGFMFVDNQAVVGQELQTGVDPFYQGLGTRFELVYLTAAEMATSVLP